MCVTNLSADSKQKNKEEGKIKTDFFAKKYPCENQAQSVYLQREGHAHSHTTECESFTREICNKSTVGHAKRTGTQRIMQ